MQKMCFCCHPFKRVSFPPFWSGKLGKMNVLGFYTICLPMDPPSDQPLEEMLVFSGEQPRNGVSCFSSSLDCIPFCRLPPLEFVLKLMQGNYGLPENTSKYNPKLSFPTVVVFKARFFCPAVAMVETKSRNPSLCSEDTCSLLGRQENTHETNAEQDKTECNLYICVVLRVTLKACNPYF